MIAVEKDVILLRSVVTPLKVVRLMMTAKLDWNACLPEVALTLMSALKVLVLELHTVDQMPTV
jgi:hypothetical protein